MTLQDHHRTRIVSAMQRRHLTCKDVARMAGVHERTVQRFVDGETFGLETLAKVEGALRLGVVTADAPPDSVRPMSANVGQATKAVPIAGWRQAAYVLGVGVRTLFRRRQRAGDATAVPWWESVKAVHDWYRRMIAKGGT